MKQKHFGKLLTALTLLVLLLGDIARTTAVPAAAAQSARQAPVLSAKDVSASNQAAAPVDGVMAATISLNASSKSRAIFVDVALLSLLLVFLSTRNQRDVLRIESAKT